MPGWGLRARRRPREHVIVDAIVVVLVVSSMAGAGLELTTQRLRVLRAIGAIPLGAFVLVSTFVPLVVTLIATRALALPASEATALFLCALAGGGSSGPSFVRMAKGDVAASGALVALLGTTSTVALLAAAPLLSLRRASGLSMLGVVAWQLVPLALGVATAVLRPVLAATLSPWAGRVGTASLLVVVAGLLVTRGHVVLEQEPRMLVACVMLAAVSLGSGWLAAGRNERLRSTFALTSCVRNLSLALLFASSTDADPRVSIDIMVYGLVMFVLALAVAMGVRRASSLRRA